MHSRGSIPFKEFNKPMHNLPFGFNVLHNTTVSKIGHFDSLDAEMQFLSKSITRRFQDSRYLFFTACLVYPIEVLFLGSIRVYFV